MDRGNAPVRRRLHSSQHSDTAPPNIGDLVFATTEISFDQDANTGRFADTVRHVVLETEIVIEVCLRDQNDTAAYEPRPRYPARYSASSDGRVRARGYPRSRSTVRTPRYPAVPEGPVVALSWSVRRRGTR